jgi:hypothetical protein
VGKILINSDQIKSIFIERIDFDLNVLTVYIRSENNRSGVISFHYPRAFQFFSESDKYSYLGSLKVSEEILIAGDGTGVITCKNSSYLSEYMRDTPKPRLDNDNYSCIVITPQECIEVIVFEDPQISLE